MLPVKKIKKLIMIMHLWLHWFWITIPFFEGFSLLMIKIIFFSYIPLRHTTEAGLLTDKNFTNHSLPSLENEQSSQNENIGNITFFIDKSEDKATNYSQTTPFVLSTPVLEDNVKSKKNKSEVFSKNFTEAPTGRIAGTTESIEVYRFSTKKSINDPNTKYIKLKEKGKPKGYHGEEEKKVESVKVLEKKLEVNLTEKEERIPERNVVGFNNSSVNISRIAEEGFEWTTSSGAVVSLDESTYDNNSTEYHKSGAPSANDYAKDVLNSQETLENSKDGYENSTLVIENEISGREAQTTVESFLSENKVAAATSAQNYGMDPTALTAGSITGITLGIFVLFSLSSAVLLLLYRRRYLNKPQVLNDKCSNLDSSGYIDDTSLKDNSEEMYSLDNDSFLNSLEAMTMHNYWTEKVKHTKL